MENVRLDKNALEGHKITVIVPCYNEQDSLPYFYSELQNVIKEMGTLDFELLFIVDGSKDNTLEKIMDIEQGNQTVSYISFSRNFGKEAAICAGLRNAKGEYVAVMDADLQDPPSLLPEMFRLVSEEGYDCAAARRTTRKGEPFIRSVFARMFYHIMEHISQANMVDGARDYRLMNRKFVDSLLEIGEYNRFSKGLFGWVGFKTKWVEFDNVERIAGKTKWSFWKLFHYSMEGIIAFSSIPLALSSFFGILSFAAAFIFLFFVIIRRLFFGDPVAGWASIVSIILFIGGIQLFCMGILGQYLSKTYLETKKRPIYIVRESNVKELK